MVTQKNEKEKKEATNHTERIKEIAPKLVQKWQSFPNFLFLQKFQMLFTEHDLEVSMDKIETLNFHEEKDVGGIKFWAYNAGHVLGAAMFMIEIAGKSKNPTL